ncbi:hypothetical protein U2088_15535, partial [Listeria monocytogenes]
SAIVERIYKPMVNRSGEVEYVPAGEKVLQVFEDVTTSVAQLNKLATPQEQEDGTTFNPYQVNETYKRTETQFSKSTVAIPLPELTSQNG